MSKSSAESWHTFPMGSESTRRTPGTDARRVVAKVSTSKSNRIGKIILPCAMPVSTHDWEAESPTGQCAAEEVVTPMS